MKYVIIGNSAAGIGAVEAIRKNDKEGEITIITDEAFHTYSRPLISYLLLGKTTRSKMKYRGDDFYEENKVTLLLSKKVVKIDPVAKQVVLGDGAAVSYDKLLVSTGSSPFIPPMAGLEKVSTKYTFANLADALALEKALTPESRVLIIGAGLIGLKCAEGIRGKVAKISVVDLAPKVLSSILDDDAALMVKEHLEGHGLEFYLNDSVKEFSGDSATLAGGVVIPFDIVVLAVGVRPNTELVKEAGGTVGRGIAIDEFMATSLPDVYAAGDCTESVDVSTGVVKIMALLPNAYMQGETAGFNMAGLKYPFKKAIPMNAIGFFGKHIITAGSYTGEVYFERTGDTYRKLYYSDNRLNGFILIGPKLADDPAFAKAGIYTNLLRERTPLDSIDFELVCAVPGMMAFSKDVRQEKLGGAV